MKALNKHILVATFVAALLIPFTSAAALNVLQPRGESDFSPGDNSGIRDYVEDVFGNNHVMVDVARCESGFRQYYSGGGVLINEESDAVGIYQLLDSWHDQAANDLGLDIYTVEGNVEYAKLLYEADGLKPWSPSSLCWDDGTLSETNGDYLARESRSKMIVRSRDTQKKDTPHKEIQAEKVSQTKKTEEVKIDTQSNSKQVILGREVDEKPNSESVEQVITKRLIIGVHDAEVLALQRLFNRSGYELASDGPGSSGEETDYFGSLTKQAVQEFQCDNDIVCSGAEYSTGYGMVNSATRKALNQLAASSDMETVRNRVQIQVRSSNTARLADNSNLQQQIRELRAQVDRLRQQLE